MHTGFTDLLKSSAQHVRPTLDNGGEFANDREFTYVGGHDHHHGPEDHLARRFMVLDLGSNGLQRADAHCRGGNVVGEDNPGSTIVDGSHSFIKPLMTAGRAHADKVGCCHGSNALKWLDSGTSEKAASDGRTGMGVIEGKKREEGEDEKS